MQLGIDSFAAAPTDGTSIQATVATQQPADATARQYANCTELRKDYRGGVARPGAVNQGGKATHQPFYDHALYEANSTSDRDKDGVSCEK